MVRPRYGRGSLGCLFLLLLLAAGAYFGIPIGEAFIRYYRFEDAMRQNVRFARINSDDVIRMRLREVADSLDLPPEAHAIVVRRYPGDRMVIDAEYVEEFDLPGTVRLHTFSPRAEGRF